MSEPWRRLGAFPPLSVAGRLAVAVVLLLSLALGSPHPVRAQTPSLKALKAKMIRQFGLKQYRETIATARQLLARTADPTYHVNIARCHDLLGEQVHALSHYREYLRVGRSQKLLAAVKNRVKELVRAQSKLMREVSFVSTPRGAEVRIGGVAICRAPCSRWLSPGRHRVVLTLAGRPSVIKELIVTLGPPITLHYRVPARRSGGLRVVSAPAGAKVFLDQTYLGVTPLTAQKLLAGPHTLRLELAGYQPLLRRVQLGEQRLDLVLRLERSAISQPKHPPRPGSRRRRFQIAAWSTLGVGVASLAAGTALYVLARSKVTDANNSVNKVPVAQRDDALVQSYNSKISSAQTFQKVAIALWSVGGALTITSAVLFIVTPRRDANRQAGYHFAPSCGPGFCGATLQGRF